MSFSLPTFNLDVNIFDGVLPLAPPRLVTVGNLAQGKRYSPYNSAAFMGADGLAGPTPLLLLPPLTDVRDSSCNNLPDIVEVPAGTGRYYQVAMVDDIGKGFPNEHRFAGLVKLFPSSGGILTATFWPTPIP